MKEHTSWRAILPVAVILCLLFVQAAGGAGKRFTGRVISTGESGLELKKGSVEMTFAYGESTKFFSREGKDAGREVIELCQVVRAEYTVNGKERTLVSVKVVRESDCYK